MRDAVYCFTNFTLHFSVLPISTFHPNDRGDRWERGREARD